MAVRLSLACHFGVTTSPSRWWKSPRRALFSGGSGASATCPRNGFAGFLPRPDGLPREPRKPATAVLRCRFGPTPTPSRTSAIGPMGWVHGVALAPDRPPSSTHGAAFEGTKVMYHGTDRQLHPQRGRRLQRRDPHPHASRPRSETHTSALSSLMRT